MVTLVELPQMTDTMTEGTLVAWLVDEGDAVRAGDAIAEIETDKAIMELEVSVDGVLLKRYFLESDDVPCGAAVAAVGDVGDTSPDAPEAPAAQAADGVAAPSEVDLPDAPSTVVGEESEPEPPDGSDDRIKASPIARRIASEKGVELDDVGGTGPDGRIVRRDIEAAASSEAAPCVSEESVAAEVTPHSRLRRIMIDRLVDTHRNVPTFTVTRRFDVDRLAMFRDELRSTDAFADGIGYTEVLVKAAALAMAREPGLNDRYGADGIERVGKVNVGIAVGLDDGVIVPVIRHCERLRLQDIVKEFRRLADRARSGTLLADDLGDSTFTISNLGMYGVDEFTAVLNAPDAAILAVGTVAEQPVVRAGEIVAGKVMTGTLTVDHRVADGVVAARWLAALAHYLENPASLVV